MPRPPRLDFPGARHHVMNRGLRHQNVFLESKDFRRFLEIMGRLPDEYGVRVHAYTLMNNHYHLLIESRFGRLSDGMQHLNSCYTQLLNRKMGWDGPIFRGRFHNQIVEGEEYWRYLLAYLHLNPVRANLVSEASLWDWSSHRSYLGQAVAPPWLETSELTVLLGGQQGVREYISTVQSGLVEPPIAFDESDLFRAAKSTCQPSRVHQVGMSITEAERSFVRIVGCRFSKLSCQTEFRWKRWLAAWWLAVAAHLRHSQIAPILDVHRSNVGRFIQRVRKCERHTCSMCAARVRLERSNSALDALPVNSPS